MFLFAEKFVNYFTNQLFYLDSQLFYLDSQLFLCPLLESGLGFEIDYGSQITRALKSNSITSAFC